MKRGQANRGFYPRRGGRGRASGGPQQLQTSYDNYDNYDDTEFYGEGYEGFEGYGYESFSDQYEKPSSVYVGGSNPASGSNYRGRGRGYNGGGRGNNQPQGPPPNSYPQQGILGYPPQAGPPPLPALVYPVPPPMQVLPPMASYGTGLLPSPPHHVLQHPFVAPMIPTLQPPAPPVPAEVRFLVLLLQVSLCLIFANLRVIQPAKLQRKTWNFKLPTLS